MRILAVLLLVCVCAFAAPYNDVPANHWAYQAISDLTARGYITGYDNGSFKGNKSVSRYELVLIVSRLLRDIDAQKIVPGSQDMELVKKLSEEFRYELDLMGIKIDSLNVAVANNDMRLRKLESVVSGEHIKSELPFRMNGEFRARWLASRNYDFDASLSDYSEASWIRSTVGLMFPVDNLAKVYLELRDERVMGQSRPGVDDENTDMHQAYVLFDNFRNKAEVKIGRQKLSYGGELLLGDNNWENRDFVFDAIKTTYNWTDHAKTDVFKAKIVESAFTGDQDLYGVYHTANADWIYWDLYYLMLLDDNEAYVSETGAIGDLSLKTFGFRLSGTPRYHWDITAEYAVQRGNSSSDDIKAHMENFTLGYVFDYPRDIRLGFEYNRATGDTNNADGQKETFSTLYPSSHYRYGIMDLAQLQNIRHVQVSFGGEIIKKLRGRIDYNKFRLDTANDFWYRPSGINVFNTNAGKDLGREIDFMLDFQFSQNIRIETGYAVFKSDSFIGDSLGVNADPRYGYIQTVVKF